MLGCVNRIYTPKYCILTIWLQYFVFLEWPLSILLSLLPACLSSLTSFFLFLWLTEGLFFWDFPFPSTHTSICMSSLESRSMLLQALPVMCFQTRDPKVVAILCQRMLFYFHINLLFSVLLLIWVFTLASFQAFYYQTLGLSMYIILQVKTFIPFQLVSVPWGEIRTSQEIISHYIFIAYRVHTLNARLSPGLCE